VNARVTRVDAARTGVKGPNAAAWLASQGVAVPPVHNTWLPLADGSLVGRLAYTEFFVEGPAATRLDAALGEGLAGVYPVLRRDMALVLEGEHALDVLAQTCNVHFGALDLDARPLVMTSMIGVSVLVIPERRADGVAYRIWCDPTYGPYLARTLQSIAAEEDGGPARARPESASTIGSRGDP
jgi:sarcosine oxidase subunit gamma